MNIFLEEVSIKYKKDLVYLICDQAPWHKSKDLKIPKNIKILFIPPATPEMNPIEQVWSYIRTNFFANKTFSSLDSFVDSLCDILSNLPLDDLKSITHRDRILSIF